LLSWIVKKDVEKIFLDFFFFFFLSYERGKNVKVKVGLFYLPRLYPRNNLEK
jgi:hypothetical protein